VGIYCKYVLKFNTELLTKISKQIHETYLILQIIVYFFSLPFLNAEILDIKGDQQFCLSH
jgi:hypothetical protein